MSDLAELEAKAKALVGTQHWRGLDPVAVLEALDDVERLRAENATLDELIKKYQTQELRTLTITTAKLTNARTEIERLHSENAELKRTKYWPNRFLLEQAKLAQAMALAHAAMDLARCAPIQFGPQYQALLAKLKEIDE